MEKGAINMVINKEITEYIKVKLETTDNCTAIAKELIRIFGINQDVETLRKRVSRYKVFNNQKPNVSIKRLFFDIETSYITFRGWRTGEQYVTHTNIVTDKKIICICYKWQYEDEIHTLKWNDKQDDKQMLKDFIKVLGQADEIVGHNGDRFDIKEIRTRAIQQGVLMFPKYRTLDTLKKARKYFNFHSNKLDYLGEVLNVGRKLDHEGFKMWVDIVENKSKSQLNKMIDYCKQDVVLLEDVFHVLSPYIDHNTNFAVTNGGLADKWKCPECASENVQFHHMDTTAMGYIKRYMKCKCKKQYHISNRTYLNYLKRNLCSQTLK